MNRMTWTVTSTTAGGADGTIIKKINAYSVKSYGLMRQLLAGAGMVGGR